MDELTLLRAPLDRTVDPLPRASAGDAVRTAASAVAVAPLTGLVRHAHVAIFEDGESTAVRIAAEGLDVRESFAAGQSQARGPRFVVEIGAQLASASRATWSLACPKTPGPAGPPAAREPDRTARTMWLLGAAIAGILATFGLVWRARRRG